MSHKFLILTALAMEAKAIEAVLTPIDAAQLRIIGIRGARLGDTLPGKEVSGIILAGLAGALDPALKVGDIVVERTDGADAVFPLLNYRTGKFHSSQSLVATSDAKAELFSRTGAAAVDMESGIVRKFAEQANLPLLIIRAISDTADQEIDPQIMECVDELGNPRPAVLAQKLARHPLLIPKLARLGYQSRLAASNMARAVLETLAPVK